MHHRLYDRPSITSILGDGGNGACTLHFTGGLPNYTKGQAYTGRLQVAGAKGGSRLLNWTGALPAGSSVSYDTTNEQVVVQWPTYSAGTNYDIPNIDFQQGNFGFANGSGIEIVQIPGQAPVDPNAPGATWYMRYLGGGGESNSLSQTYQPATPGKTYTASVDVFRTSTRKHADGAAVRILFYDANKVQIGGADGNVVKEEHDLQWHTSSVSVGAPANAAFVRLGVAFYRIHDNNAVLAANLRWNGQVIDGSQQQGYNGDAPFPMAFTVADADGCQMTWRGSIQKGSGIPAARMWRLWITANRDSGDGAFMNLSLIALQEQAGGPNLCVGSGGVASESSKYSGVYGAVNAFENPNIDGHQNPNGRFWHSADQEPYSINSYGGKTPANPWWAAYDFGAGVVKQVSYITFVPTNQADRYPADFEVQTSNDGVTWTTVASFTNITASLGSPRTLAL